MKTLHILRSLIITTPLLIACQSGESESTAAPHPELPDTWVGQLQISDSASVPFNFHWDGYTMTIHNGTEAIYLNDISREGDTTLLHMPVFQGGFRVVITENDWNGYYVKYDSETKYEVPFHAVRGEDRFSTTSAGNGELKNRYRVEFRTGTDNPKDAIGEFDFGTETVTGTFRTETGDYRYLEGVYEGNHLRLSSFDGIHVYLFDAYLDGDTLRGMHYSGMTYAKAWKAWVDDSFELRDPNKLSGLKEGYDGVAFTARSIEDGSDYTFDSHSINHPVIIQIMGSWCPNCMDETRYFNELYKKYGSRGLEIIGVTFERTADLEVSEPAIARMIADLNIPYTIVYGGKADGEAIAETLPMIDNFMSYPTSIILDGNGKVMQIHTGFAGPGTRVYDEYTRETEALIESLLN